MELGDLMRLDPNELLRPPYQKISRRTLPGFATSGLCPDTPTAEQP